jgi:hypothetical protein
MDKSRRKPNKGVVTKGAKGILNFLLVLDRTFQDGIYQVTDVFSEGS